MAAGLPIVRSGGVLVLAKRKGLIRAIQPLLLELRTAGLYLSDAVFETLLELASES